MTCAIKPELIGKNSGYFSNMGMGMGKGGLGLRVIFIKNVAYIQGTLHCLLLQKFLYINISYL